MLLHILIQVVIHCFGWEEAPFMLSSKTTVRFYWREILLSILVKIRDKPKERLKN